MVKVKAQEKDVAEIRITNRKKVFKTAEVKPVGCLKTHIGCNKTEHFTFKSEKGIVRCMFDSKDGCISPFPRKEKPKKSKQKKSKKTVSSDKLGNGSILAGDEKLDKSSEGHASIKKTKVKGRKRKAKLVQMEFEVDAPRPKRLKEKEHKVKVKDKHSEKKSLKAKSKAKGFL